MRQSVEIFREKMRDLSKDTGLLLSDEMPSRPRMTLQFTPVFPLWLNVEIDEGEDFAFIYASVRAHGVDGDKSDWHDFLSGIFALCLRLLNIASSRLVKLEMADILPGEIYLCNIFFDKQPPTTFVNLNQPDFESIRRLLEGSVFVASLISLIWRLSGEGQGEGGCLNNQESEWASKVRSSLRLKPGSKNADHYSRRNPTWEYFHLIDRDIFAGKLCVPLTKLPRVQSFLKDLTVLEGVDGRIVESPATKNFVSYKTLKTASKMLKAFGQTLEHAVLVPIESHLFLLADKGIIGIESDCGFEAYLAEKARVLQRHRLEARTLLPTVRFDWSSPVDDEEFEKLILELLTREPGVLRARKLGKGREPDFGRDILVEWYRATEPTSTDHPISLQRVTVQCKAASRPVGKSQVRDILDLLAFHQATGYLLVALSGVTKPLIDFLENLNQRVGYWADWWTRIEIEAKLRANRDIANRYSHIVRMRDCEAT